MGVSIIGANAARPTSHASNFTYNNLHCNTVILQWTAGNGSARMVIGKIGSKPDFKPSDNTVYSATPNFGSKASKFGANSDNFIVYNSNGNNFIKIDSLLPCTDYYFTIIEHDNAGSSTQYIDTPAPVLHVKTYCVNLDFDVLYHDSCQAHNSYTFTNKSTSTIPGISYEFDFADGNTSTSSPVTHSYTISGLVPAKIKAITSVQGCPTSFVKGVRVYQKKVVFLDFTNPKTTDTIQCLDGNLFKLYTGNYTNPLSGSYGYRWFTPGDTQVFSFFQKSFTAAGYYSPALEVTTNISRGPNTYPTGCKDTLYFKLRVLPSPVGSISPFDTVQCVTKNSFFFNNTDPNNILVTFKWYFGDDDSSYTKSATHKYQSPGNYTVRHEATDTAGCAGKDTVYVQVKPDLITAFTGLDTVYCSSNSFDDLEPVKKGGRWEGYPTQGDSIIPNVPGTYTMMYIVKDTFCEDTAVQSFRIDKSPLPDLGNDKVICSEDPALLYTNEPGSKLWNTGEITDTIYVHATGTYSVEVKLGQCPGVDSAKVTFSTTPRVNLGSDTILCKGGSLKLIATSPQGNYLWNTGNTDSVIYAFNPGKYVVSVTNPCGTSRDSIFINYQSDYCDLFMANAFTPGNDLVNNIFMPRGRNITVTSFQIYNRWGELIFETNRDGEGWDGKFNGDYCPDGLYIWKLHYNTVNGPYLKKNNAFGQVLLIR